MSQIEPESGGFFLDDLPNGLPSPAPSSPRPPDLPRPRSQPLRAGSSKEDAIRRYVENELLKVSRRYTKKFQEPESGEGVVGYRHMRDVCHDLGAIVDVIWLSGTPSLQVPYLLNIALSFSAYLSAFPADPSPTFAFLRKLDHAFASLLQGHDVETGELLPGCHGTKSGMSSTDMVRCKSLVEGIRVQVVEIMTGERETEHHDPSATETSDRTDTETDTEGRSSDFTRFVEDAGDDSYEMDVARVFERTIVELGQSLTGGSAFNAAS